MKKYKAVLLDFDDTLIDTQGYAKTCLRNMFKEFHLDKYFESFDVFFKTYHEHTHQLWTEYALNKIDKATLMKERFSRPLVSTPFSEKEVEKINNHFLSQVIKINETIEGAHDLLEYLKNKGYKLVMLSNGFSEMQYDKISNVGFDGFFDEVILSDAVGVNKPHRIIFEKALEEVGVTANEAIMIGDNFLADIIGAKKSGIDQIWYNPHKIKEDEKATYEVTTLKEIMNIL